MDELGQALVLYGVRQIARQTGAELASVVSRLSLTTPEGKWWVAYEGLLAGGELPPEGLPTEPLLSIFSLIHLEGAVPSPAYHRPCPLALDKDVLFPRSEHAPLDPTELRELGNGFAAELGQVAISPADSCFFELFYHLYHKWAWALPCTYGEQGVSLFQQWKAVAGLAFATGERWVEGPARDFTLIGGDIPGIQDFVYTITSKGAAKGLRGRSFFIQLLGDAVVRRLISDLGLCPASVIYNAGGNFMVLGPAGQRTKDVLRGIDDDINRTLLHTYEGDVALCLASMTMPSEVVGTAEFGMKYSLELKQAVAQQKARWFVEIANGEDGWRVVFEPKGGGGERAHFCAVCQAELNVEELRDDELLLVDIGELEPGETAPRACYDCATFRELAEAVGRPHQALYLRCGGGRGGNRWQTLLYDLSGWWYRFDDRAAPALPGETKYMLNSVGLVEFGAQGFLFLSSATPRVTPRDVEWWDESYPDQRDKIKVGDIRNFELLAHAAQADGALERVGVLRMDVDNLGQVMARGLVSDGQPHRNMVATSALSMALDRFFAGYLDVLCQEVTEKPNMAELPGHEDEGLLYVIYAGGDDLFVVGSWHLLPLLAEGVRNAFEQYVGRNASLHISAGITLEGRKFPQCLRRGAADPDDVVGRSPEGRVLPATPDAEA